MNVPPQSYRDHHRGSLPRRDVKAGREFGHLVDPEHLLHFGRGGRQIKAIARNTDRSAVRDDDLAEMTASLEMAVGFLCLGQREDPINHWAQAMQPDGSVHRLEMGAAANADRTEDNATAGQQQGIESGFRCRYARADQADVSADR